ncbi:MAG: MBL fold metallo-hydrolase [Actinomycetota bacterium]
MIELTVLLDGQPLRTREGIVGFCSNVLIEGTKRTLVDVGHVGRRTALQTSLKSRGLTPEDIDCVVLTHSHWDHAQNLDVFPNAEILMHPAERKYAENPHANDWATPAWTGKMIEHQTSIVEVEEGSEIEPGVSILYTPGHSPGSVCVAVTNGERLSVVTGDVLQYSTAALTKVNPVVFWSDAQATSSIERVLELADVIYPGHDRPFRLVEDKIEYEYPLSLAFMGVDPDEAGVEFSKTPAPRFVMPGIEEQSL